MENKISCTIHGKQQLSGDLFQKKRLSVGLSKAKNYLDPYEGPYEVTSGWVEESLETKGKSMKENVTVNVIPIFEVENPKGGNTVIIGL